MARFSTKELNEEVVTRDPVSADWPCEPDGP